MFRKILVIVTGVLVPSVALANMGYSAYGMGWWGMGAGMLFFWILVIILLALLVKWMVYQGKGGHETASRPLDILKERYAKGEITKEQFEQMKKDLQ